MKPLEHRASCARALQSLCENSLTADFPRLKREKKNVSSLIMVGEQSDGSESEKSLSSAA